ncbi:S1 family peptidase [Amycolatopsis suaedae]|uniref:S1 family peptidase n=1 Tax=Amycolatopsis suaedae TaxID=2510978 RepID=UPI0013EF11ED|nr:serine protease [Amycolatopsis suaedae]
MGGNPASTKDYPWLLSFEQIIKTSIDTVASWRHGCGATLVGPNKAVTAAHCVPGLAPDQARVVQGRDKTSSREGKTVKVDSIWSHPKFDGLTQHGYDVAVLTLRESLPGPYLPIASAEDRDLYTEGQHATVAGWGAVRHEGRGSGELRAAQVSVYSEEMCSNDYPDDKPRNGQFCAGFPEGGVDTCQGDSGGPLIVDGKLAGVVSWGHDCAAAGTAGIYADVSRYSPLLRQQIGDVPAEETVGAG